MIQNFESWTADPPVPGNDHMTDRVHSEQDETEEDRHG